MEIVGGINVSPREVEAVLLEHGAVREVVVAVVPDARGADKLRAGAVTGAPESGFEALARAPRTFTGEVRRSVARTGTR